MRKRVIQASDSMQGDRIEVAPADSFRYGRNSCGDHFIEGRIDPLNPPFALLEVARLSKDGMFISKDHRRLATVFPTDGGVPLPREPGSRSTATAPRACDGHGPNALGTERHQGATRRTSPRAGARRNGLEPNGYGWVTIVTRTLLGQNLSMANTTNEGHKNWETRR